MATFEALLDRLDRLLLRYEEAQRRQALLESQVEALTLERDSLRSRLAAARGRIDALLDRLPPDASGGASPAGGAQPEAEPSMPAHAAAVAPEPTRDGDAA